jgi:hypothetical protein
MKKFYPVIHCINPFTQGGIKHALCNARIAYDNNADGVFLIGHNLAYLDLMYIYDCVRRQFPDKWVGVNFLDISSSRLYLLNGCGKLLTNLNALWFDSLPFGKIFPENLEVFGSIAFKYINPNPSDDELKRDCEQVLMCATTATTSGNKTGEPPSIEKLQKIQILLQSRVPLAIASGIDANNVSSFLPYADSFLVASSIIRRDLNQDNHEYFVPEKVRELADLIHL